jgi:hypothetical protein
MSKQTTATQLLHEALTALAVIATITIGAMIVMMVIH